MNGKNDDLTSREAKGDNCGCSGELHYSCRPAAQEAAKPAVPDGWVPLVFIRLLDVARRVPNFTGKGNPPWTCTDVDLNDAVEQCDEYLKAALGVGK